MFKRIIAVVVTTAFLFTPLEKVHLIRDKSLTGYTQCGLGMAAQDAHLRRQSRDGCSSRSFGTHSHPSLPPTLEQPSLRVGKMGKDVFAVFGPHSSLRKEQEETEAGASGSLAMLRDDLAQAGGRQYTPQSQPAAGAAAGRVPLERAIKELAENIASNTAHTLLYSTRHYLYGGALSSLWAADVRVPILVTLIENMLDENGLPSDEDTIKKVINRACAYAGIDERLAPLLYGRASATGKAVAAAAVGGDAAIHASGVIAELRKRIVTTYMNAMAAVEALGANVDNFHLDYINIRTKDDREREALVKEFIGSYDVVLLPTRENNNFRIKLVYYILMSR